MENEVVDALNLLAGSRQARAASLPATLAQSCSLKALANAVAHAGPPPEGLDGPGSLSELRVVRSCTDTPVDLALLDVGALALAPRGFQPRYLDELVGPSFAYEMVQRPSAKLLSDAAQVEAQRRSGLSHGYVDRGVGKCRPRYRELVRALFKPGVIKVRKKARSLRRLEKEWRPAPHHRRAFPKHCF